ncbi:MAG: hypothetical protein RLZZ444_2849 [Pseudomonadota bacterium]
MTDRFSNFADLAEHYAREIATPDYARAFMEQTELAKLSIEHEPSAAEMPDPEVAQAAIEMMLATVFDLFRDTRMEDFASEVACQRHESALSCEKQCTATISHCDVIQSVRIFWSKRKNCLGMPTM